MVYAKVTKITTSNIYLKSLRKSFQYLKTSFRLAYRTNDNRRTIPVMVAYSRTVPYAGSADLSHRLMSFIEGVSHKLEAFVLMGNPYAARQLPHQKRIIFGYEGGVCEESAIKALSGHFKPKGKLPVNMKLRKK